RAPKCAARPYGLRCHGGAWYCPSLLVSVLIRLAFTDGNDLLQGGKPPTLGLFVIFPMNVRQARVNFDNRTPQLIVWILSAVFFERFHVVEFDDGGHVFCRFFMPTPLRIEAGHEAHRVSLQLLSIGHFVLNYKSNLLAAGVGVAMQN